MQLHVTTNDRELIAQLTSRQGWPDSKGRLVLEPKSDLRSRNLPSPDRADAVLGALIGMMPGAQHAPIEAEVVHIPGGSRLAKDMEALGACRERFDGRGL